MRQHERWAVRAAAATCAVLSSASLQVAAAAAPPPSGTTVTTQPAFSPSFERATTDYTVRCVGNSAVAVKVATARGERVSVAGQSARSGTFTAAVPLEPGQQFTFSVVPNKGRATAYHVRCLPADFPSFSAEVTGSREASYYITLNKRFTPGASSPYAIIFDNNGVPIWWKSAPDGLYATLLSGNHVAWTQNGASPGVVETTLSGALIRTLHTVGGGADYHDVQRLPSGDYLMATAEPRCCVDLSPYGGPSDATVLDAVVEELTAAGELVRSWDTMAHVPPSEVPAYWMQTAVNGGSPYDIYHWNSLEPAGADGFIASFRHLNAVYFVDFATGGVRWKLGGVKRRESLQVIGDPIFDRGEGLSGQHDARLLPDGTVTLHDNGTQFGRPPRAVRYSIDTGAQTATLVEDERDGRVDGSSCCGSARRMPKGDWVASWGFANFFTELSARGAAVFTLHWSDSGTFSYRAEPIPPGIVDAAALRSGMDAMYAATAN